MAAISWGLVAIFVSSGIAMALLSCLIGIPPKVENPAWWGLYAVWIGISLFLKIDAPFSTLLVSSILAGLLHGTTCALLFDQYIANNPWHQEKMQGPRKKLKMQFIFLGIAIGTVFGAIVGGIAWGINRL